jgi:hypothetical protein
MRRRRCSADYEDRADPACLTPAPSRRARTIEQLIAPPIPCDHPAKKQDQPEKRSNLSIRVHPVICTGIT